MIDQVAHFIDSKLGDTELQSHLIILKQNETPELQLANHALVFLKTMELVKIALEAPMLLEGLTNSRSNAIAMFLVSSLRTLGAPIRCPKYHRF